MLTEEHKPQQLEKTMPEDDSLSMVKSISLEVTGVVGKVKLPLKKVLQLDRGSVVELDRDEGEDIDLLINGKKVARAQIVAVGNKYGLKLTKILN